MAASNIDLSRSTEELTTFVSGASEPENRFGEPNSISQDMTQPDWATELISEACLLRGRRIPKVKWYQTKHSYSTGRTFRRPKRGYRIHISLGIDNENGKQVLCHELAHYFGRPNWGHNKKFWLILKQLLEYFNLITDEYKQRESNYMRRSANYL